LTFLTIFFQVKAMAILGRIAAKVKSDIILDRILPYVVSFTQIHRAVYLKSLL
jgi:hypothetical protein